MRLILCNFYNVKGYNWFPGNRLLIQRWSWDPTFSCCRFCKRFSSVTTRPLATTLAQSPSKQLSSLSPHPILLKAHSTLITKSPSSPEISICVSSWNSKEQIRFNHQASLVGRGLQFIGYTAKSITGSLIKSFLDIHALVQLPQIPSSASTIQLCDANCSPWHGNYV